uniref:Capsid protein n=1 Tax=Dulem virus 199 TaxID=3145676 RepID=A0AAU8AZF2_9VIRU
MRRKMSSRGSKRLFTRTAGNTRAINLRAIPMRGGFRL